MDVYTHAFKAANFNDLKGERERARAKEKKLVDEKLVFMNVNCEWKTGIAQVDT